MPDLLTCPVCEQKKAVEEFPSRGKQQRRKMCSECFLRRRRESWRKHDKKRNAKRRLLWRKDKAYRDRNRSAARRTHAKYKTLYRANDRKRWKERRERVIIKYGGVCDCCGEKCLEFLSVDHVNGGGNTERRLIQTSGIYRKLDLAQLKLEGYRVLCHNCNLAIGFYGHCPHKAQKG